MTFSPQAVIIGIYVRFTDSSGGISRRVEGVLSGLVDFSAFYAHRRGEFIGPERAEQLPGT